MKPPREQFWEALSLVSLTLFFHPPKMLSVLSEESAGMNCKGDKVKCMIVRPDPSPFSALTNI